MLRTSSSVIRANAPQHIGVPGMTSPARKRTTNMPSSHNDRPRRQPAGLDFGVAHSERPPAAGEALARHVRQRSRLLTRWVAILMGMGIVAVLALTAVIVARPDPFERRHCPHQSADIRRPPVLRQRRPVDPSVLERADVHARGGRRAPPGDGEPGLAEYEERPRVPWGRSQLQKSETAEPFDSLLASGSLEFRPKRPRSKLPAGVPAGTEVATGIPERAGIPPELRLCGYSPSSSQAQAWCSCSRLKPQLWSVTRLPPFFPKN
jgi:hypothetical protein